MKNKVLKEKSKYKNLKVNALSCMVCKKFHKTLFKVDDTHYICKSCIHTIKAHVKENPEQFHLARGNGKTTDKFKKSKEETEGSMKNET